MEIEQLRKTEFREMAKSIGIESHVVVREGDEWFEQLTEGDVAYRYKVLAIQEVSRDALEKMSLSEGCLPIRLKDQQSNTYAQTYFKGTKVYYCLNITSKREKAFAKQLVLFFAQHEVQTKTEKLLVVNAPVATN